MLTVISEVKSPVYSQLPPPFLRGAREAVYSLGYKRLLRFLKMSGDWKLHMHYKF